MAMAHRLDRAAQMQFKSRRVCYGRRPTTLGKAKFIPMYFRITGMGLVEVKSS